MIRRQRYSQEYKESLVLEIISGQSRVAQVSRREGISPATLSKWRDQLATAGFQQEKQGEIELRRRVKDLESAVSELALENHILKKAQKLLQEHRQKERSSKIVLAQSSR